MLILANIAKYIETKNTHEENERFRYLSVTKETKFAVRQENSFKL